MKGIFVVFIVGFIVGAYARGVAETDPIRVTFILEEGCCQSVAYT